MARTRAADYDDKRHAILRRSAKVFAENGIDRASMQQVARECGVSKALLYHYYGSKDELLFDIIRSHLEALDAAISAADDPAAAPPQRLRALVRRTLETYQDADDNHKVQLVGMSVLSAEQAAEIRAVERRIVRRFAAVLKLINPALVGERSLVLPVTMSLVGMLNWVYLWFRPDGPITREQYADLATTLMLHGVSALDANQPDPLPGTPR